MNHTNKAFFHGKSCSHQSLKIHIHILRKCHHVFSVICVGTSVANTVEHVVSSVSTALSVLQSAGTMASGPKAARAPTHAHKRMGVILVYTHTHTLHVLTNTHVTDMVGHPHMGAYAVMHTHSHGLVKQILAC